MSGRPSLAPGIVRVAWALGLATFVLAGCEDLLQEPDSGLVPLPVGLELVSGDAQVGAARQPLAAPLRVRVLDAEGRPASRIRVEWTAGPGSGGARPRNSFSDADGIATTTWTLGEAEKQQLKAEVGVFDAVTFHATATP